MPLERLAGEPLVTYPSSSTAAAWRRDDERPVLARALEVIRDQLRTSA